MYLNNLEINFVKRVTLHFYRIRLISKRIYICFDPITNNIYISKDVIFVENKFYFADQEKEKEQEKED